MNSVARVLRDHRLHFRTGDLCRWLSEFHGKRPENNAETDGKRFSLTREPRGKQTGNDRDVSSRANSVSLGNDCSSSPSDSQSATQEKLGLIDPTEAEARRILEAIWPIVAERVKSSMTKTAWKKRNKATALDLVRANVPIERIIAAHAELSHQRGDVIFTLSWVQDHLAKMNPAKVIPLHQKTVPENPPAWLAHAMERGKADAERRSAEPERKVNST